MLLGNYIAQIVSELIYVYVYAYTFIFFMDFFFRNIIYIAMALHYNLTEAMAIQKFTKSIRSLHPALA